MFNPLTFENSPPDGHGVLEIVVLAPETDRRRQFVPLRETTLTGVLAGPLASLTVTQVFAYSREQCDKVLEAAYRFPLPGDAAVTGVRVTFGEVEIVADLKARPQAEEEYAAAKKEGRQAALMTRESPDVFTLQVAGIRPDEPITVATSYVQLARSEGLAWLLRLPLTTAPRYVREDERHSTHAAGQPLALARDPGHRFKLDIEIEHAATVTSPTHALAVEQTGQGLQVRLADGDIVPDRDCVLCWSLGQDETQPALHLVCHTDEDSIYFLALIAPPLTAPAAAGGREILMLVDHSGSMNGPKWEAADWSVERFLSDLNDRDQFGLCLFESRSHWFDRCVSQADAAVVAKAVSWMKKNRESGGTNLGVALEEALTMPRAKGEFARNLLIVTDAEVSDAGRILRLADEEQARSDRRRISVLCIDAAPNAFLAQELADRGGGIARFLTSDPTAEDITTALETVLRAWSTPVLTNARLEANRPTLQVSGQVAARGPKSGWSAVDLGDLTVGAARWVVGCAPRGNKNRLTVRVATGRDTVAEATVDLTKALRPLPALKTLFGVRRVNALEYLSTAQYNWTEFVAQLARLGYRSDQVATEEPAAVYGELQNKQTREAVAKLLVTESLRYGVLSSATGFVAVRTEAGLPVAETVVVANALPHGWSDAFLSTPGPLPQVLFMRRSSIHEIGKSAPMAALPVMAAMPNPAQMMADALGLGGPAASWHTVFRGGLTGGVQTLYDSQAGGGPLSGVVSISGVRLTMAAGQAELNQSLHGLLLMIYVGDLAIARARVQLVDLLRHGDRPLNLVKRAQELLRVVVVGPERSDPRPVVEIAFEWSAAR